MTTIRLTPNLITNHCMVRWLERVEGYDLKPYKQAMRDQGLDPSFDKSVVRYLDEHARFPIDAIREELNAVVRKAVAIKSTTVNYRGARIRLIDGIAATVLASGQKRRSRPPLSGDKLRHPNRRGVHLDFCE